METKGLVAANTAVKRVRSFLSSSTLNLRDEGVLKLTTVELPFPPGSLHHWAEQTITGLLECKKYLRRTE